MPAPVGEFLEGTDNTKLPTPGRLRVVLFAVAAAVMPVAILLDLARPVLLERGTLEALNTARAEPKPIFYTVDYALGALLLSLLAGIAVLTCMRKRRALGRLAMLVWSVVVPCACIETTLQLTTRPYFFRPGLSIPFDPDPRIMPGVGGPNRFTTNARGIRGPDWDERSYRILCVGGSTTICTYLDDEKTWCRHLMKILNARRPRRGYWVGGLGKSGHDTYHHIELLKRLPEARSVDCCLVLCGANDLDHALRLPHDLRARLAPSGVFEVGGSLRPTVPYLKQTRLYRWARSLAGHAVPSDALEIEDRVGKSYALRRQARRAARKDYSLPDLEKHLEVYRRNLVQIADLCRDLGVRCIFVTQPTLWHDNMAPDLEALLWCRPIGSTGRALAARDLALGMDAFNCTLKEFCRDTGIGCIDLADVCPKDRTVFYDDEHFNESGARRVANVIADWLLHAGVGSDRRGRK